MSHNFKKYIGKECYIHIASTPELVSCDETKRVRLSVAEYEVLSYLIDHVNEQVTLEVLAKSRWGINHDKQPNSQVSQITYVRKKLNMIREGLGGSIKTIQGLQSYMLVISDEKDNEIGSSGHGNRTPNGATIAKRKIKYFEKLWSNHVKGEIRDMPGTGMVRELIDYYVVPPIAESDDEDAPNLYSPFSGTDIKKFVYASSGFGKTSLFDVLILCSTINELISSDSSVLSENSKNKKNDYCEIKKLLLGNIQNDFFPVYFHSDRANKEYGDVLELAEASEVESFKEMLEEAYKSDSLLFLIDSVDEVEQDKLNDYLDSIKTMLSDYPKANVIIASRFLGKVSLPFECGSLYIKRLNMTDIEKITFSILSQNEAEKLINQFIENKYLRSLATNPFMLMTILEIKEDRIVHRLIESIVNAIIDRRWDKHHYDISTENLKKLLGFLACKFVFDNKTSVDVSAVGQCFRKVRDNLEEYDVPYNVPEKNIESLLKTLSSQSGILNIVNQRHIDKYLFQDRLIMCWLAANYINIIINNYAKIKDRGGFRETWANTLWLGSFLRSISSEDVCLSENAVNTLILVLVQSQGQVIQQSILYYLICRDAISTNKNEQLNIHNGYKDLIANVFGNNNITNLDNSDANNLIKRMLNSF